MAWKKAWCLAISAAVVLALALPVRAEGPGVRIKVIVESSSLRVKPNMDSEVLEENVPLGTIFDGAVKSGEWFEVKYRSNLGVMITGFIHEMYVEVLPAAAAPAKPEVRPAEKKPAPATPMGLRPSPRLELAATFGLGLGTPADGTSNFAWDVAPEYVLLRERGQGSLTDKVKALQGLGLSLTYLLESGLGFQVRADVNFKQDGTGDSGFDLNWTWTDSTVGSRHAAWPVTGEMTSVPISIDVLYKFEASPIFRPYAGAGVSVFTGKFKADSIAGFPFWFVDWGLGMQFVDYLAVPVHIDQSLNSVGGNVQAGVDLNLSPNFGLTLGGIYFLGKEFSFRWNPQAGSYRGEVHPAYAPWIFNSDLANDFGGKFSRIKVTTSIFKLVAGLKLGF